MLIIIGRGPPNSPILRYRVKHYPTAPNTMINDSVAPGR